MKFSRLPDSAPPVFPARLRPGDTIGVVSPSWGGPACFPHVFDLGLNNLRSEFGVKIKEFPTARMSDEELRRNPRARAKDINAAFADPEVHAIISSIGGDDSLRILPYLDEDLIRRNPKIIVGFSDTATLLTYINHRLNLVTFNGPSVMAGFAQLRHLPPAFARHIRKILMEPAPTHDYAPFGTWTDGYVDWGTSGYDGEVKSLQPNDQRWQWLQGEGVAEGRLFGGCIEVLEFMKGTQFWPPSEFWSGRILFLETSEDKPSVSFIRYWLRNYGVQGVFDQITSLLIGRPMKFTPEEKQALYQDIVEVVAEEFGRPDLAIVANMDFGHTDPQWILPLGVQAEVDCEQRTFRLLEAAVR
jgi:muramoyltetrapeptide carboxypeptidase LdcA involved in peptidoglycan recycling